MVILKNSIELWAFRCQNNVVRMDVTRSVAVDDYLITFCVHYVNSKLNRCVRKKYKSINYAKLKLYGNEWYIVEDRIVVYDC